MPGSRNSPFHTRRRTFVVKGMKRLRALSRLAVLFPPFFDQINLTQRVKGAYRTIKRPIPFEV